jgi:hypothetical protein
VFGNERTVAVTVKVEMVERFGLGETLGILRYAQDDSKSKGNGKSKSKGNGNGKSKGDGFVVQLAPEFPPFAMRPRRVGYPSFCWPV